MTCFVFSEKIARRAAQQSYVRNRARVGDGSCANRWLTRLLDATHIFDGLNEFPTHIAHMRLGSFIAGPVQWPPVVAEPKLRDIVHASNQSLYRVALQWLREDREHRRVLEEGGRKARGARRDQVSINGCTVVVGSLFRFACQTTPSESEKFYKQ